VASSLRRLGLTALLVATLSACTGPFLAPPPPAPPVGSREQYLVDGINSIRAGRGLAPLATDGALMASARAWAAVLAAEGGLRHMDLAQLPLPFSAAGENVAVAGDVAQAHLALVQSPGHFANMVNPAYTKVGTARVRAGGRAWVVEQFCRC
jgi:uncharacterized protein YkwD